MSTVQQPARPVTVPTIAHQFVSEGASQHHASALGSRQLERVSEQGSDTSLDFPSTTDYLARDLVVAELTLNNAEKRLSEAGANDRGAIDAYLGATQNFENTANNLTQYLESVVEVVQRAVDIQRREAETSALIARAFS